MWCKIPVVKRCSYYSPRLLCGVWKPASNEVWKLYTFFSFTLPSIFFYFSNNSLPYYLTRSCQILEMSLTTKECALAAILLVLDQVHNCEKRVWASPSHSEATTQPNVDPDLTLTNIFRQDIFQLLFPEASSTFPSSPCSYSLRSPLLWDKL